MFNFFEAIKEEISGKAATFVDSYHIVNLSSCLLYVEGHKGLVTLSAELVSFKVKSGVIVVEGEKLALRELTENTLKIEGKIKKVEEF